MKIPAAVTAHIEQTCARLEKSSPKLAQLYRNCFPNTTATPIQAQEDGSLFVITGDIPAMWLRDSAPQVDHYIPLAGDPEVASIVRRVVEKQFQYVHIDPYANSINPAPNGEGHITDIPRNGPRVFER